LKRVGYCGGYDVNNQADKEILQHKKAGELIYTVGCVVGTTFTGEADPVEEINGVLRDFTRVPLAGPDFTYYADVPIHVDAASGGFVMPFTAPNTKWDFQLEHVQSINVSNHKFGLVYPGCGTVVFRDADVVASELIYNISYLGGSFTDYTLNFSRGSAMVLASYYNLVRLGLKGYAEVNTNCVKHAQYLRKVIEEGPVTGKMFEVISDTDILPMVVWRDKRPTEEKDKWDLSELSNELLTYRWSLPAYKLPFTSSEDPDGPLVMRVVTRQDVSTEKVNDLYESILKSIATLDARWGDADLTDPNVQAVKDRVRTAATRTGTMD
jgi:glutamate decarboxylase